MKLNLDLTKNQWKFIKNKLEPFRDTSPTIALFCNEIDYFSPVQKPSLGTLLKSADAGRYLGVSVQSLRRYRDAEGGFLVENEDWFWGAYENSPIRWNVEKCQEKLKKKRNVLK
jgi:hypothetical protein